MTRQPYHHGRLRETLIEAAIEAIREFGPTGWSLRDLARRAAVSHAAPAYHFGDKSGLLTALAVVGYRRLADDLDAVWRETNSFLEVGVGYVRFAIDNRPLFEVMFRPELLRRDDPELWAARAASSSRLHGPLATVAAADPEFDDRIAAIAAWSLVHGLATLALNGNLPEALSRDPESAARVVAGYLFRSVPATALVPSPVSERARSGVDDPAAS